MYKLLNNMPDIGERPNYKLEDLKTKDIVQVDKMDSYYFISIRTGHIWVFDSSTNKFGLIFTGPFLVRYEDKTEPVDVEQFKKDYLS